jgi:prepilin-type N-terminal cleavage/methylation domain-containing protein
MKKQTKFSGFSLLEVSISLLILGVISGVCVTQLNMINTIYASQKTQNNIDFVIKAIAAYCISNDGRLPFPSSASRDIGFQDESMKNSFGIVPFRTIGIMEKFAKNGKGKRLFYKMNPLFGQPVSQGQARNLGISEFHSEIKDDKVAFVLKSQDNKGKDEIVIWLSEKSFVSNYMNGVIMKKSIVKTESIEEAI